MRIPVFAIADPHLGRSIGHSMAEYGGPWVGHPQNLFERWDRAVPDDALVLVPGDLSVASRREDIVADYADLDARRGATKLLSHGNHDWCWSTQGAVEKMCAGYETLIPLKGQARRFAISSDGPGLVVAATCLSLTPGSEYFDSKEQHAQRYAKELKRLPSTLEKARALMGPDDSLVVQVHYPPFAHLNESSLFTELIEAAGARLCVYGHIHNTYEHELAFQGNRGGCEYRLVAADYLQMTPTCVGELTEHGFSLAPLALAAGA